MEDRGASLLPMEDPRWDQLSSIALDSSVIMWAKSQPRSKPIGSPARAIRDWERYEACRSVARSFILGLVEVIRRRSFEVLLPAPAFEDCVSQICMRHLAKQATQPDTWETVLRESPCAVRDPDCVNRVNGLCTFLNSLRVRVLGPIGRQPVGPWRRAVTRWVGVLTSKLRVPPSRWFSGNRPVSMDGRLPRLCQEWCVMPKDAMVLSVAKEHGVETVATVDRDWSHAVGFTIVCPEKAWPPEKTT